MIKIIGFLVFIVPTAAISQNFVYADTCAGGDIGAKINSCRDSLPLGTDPLTSGYRVGTIILPNTSSETNLKQWSTKVVLGPGVNLMGQGLFASAFTCSVNNDDCLVYDATTCSNNDPKCGLPLTTYSHTVQPNTVYEGFSITGSSTTAPLNIFDFKDAMGVTVRDVAADGAYLGGGACFLLQNVITWTERNLFENVSTLYNCNIGWRFTVVGPHNSFGYNRLLDIQSNPVTDQSNPVTKSTTWNQIAFSFEGSTFFYNSTIRATANVNPGYPGATGVATVVHMQDTAEVYFNEVHLYGENDTVVPQNAFNLTTGSNHFTYLGDINFTPGMLTNMASGAFVTHWMDDWSYFNAGQNQFGNSVLFSNSIQLGTASWSHGAGGPTNPCTNGSLYSNTAGGTGSTLYVCVNSAWQDIK